MLLTSLGEWPLIVVDVAKQPSRSRGCREHLDAHLVHNVSLAHYYCYELCIGLTLSVFVEIVKNKIGCSIAINRDRTILRAWPNTTTKSSTAQF
jgi:hypothetical protein